MSEDKVAKYDEMGVMDGGTIGHGIAERHTQFDDVGARRRQALDDFQRCFRIGVTGGDEDGQPREGGQPPGCGYISPPVREH